MAFVTIAGTPFEVLVSGGATEHTRTDRRAATEGISTYSGSLRRQGSVRKREWIFPLAPLAQADFTTLITLAYGAAFRLCAGDAMPAGGVNCLITVDEGPYVEDTSDALGFKRTAQVTFREK